MKNRQKLTNIRSGGIFLAKKNDIAIHVKIINTDGKYVLCFKLENEKLVLNSTEDEWGGQKVVNMWQLIVFLN